MAKTLKVKAVEDRMQPNFAAFDAGVIRFVGRRFDPTAGESDSKYDKMKDLLTKDQKAAAASSKHVKQGGFVVLEDGEEVPMIAEYIQAVKEGDLLPMDQETARLCGVKFQAVQTSLAVTVSK